MTATVCVESVGPVWIRLKRVGDRIVLSVEGLYKQRRETENEPALSVLIMMSIRESSTCACNFSKSKNENVGVPASIMTFRTNVLDLTVNMFHENVTNELPFLHSEFSRLGISIATQSNVQS